MPFDDPVCLATISEKGQDAAEYALLIALIAIVIIAAVTLVGVDLSVTYTWIVANLP